jgi:UDP-N-acetylmuramoylalanine-D-glutamate ligase
LPKKPKFEAVVVDSMKNALAEAKTVAKKGDIVLLSPGAKSFGVFKNEYDAAISLWRLSKN